VFSGATGLEARRALRARRRSQCQGETRGVIFIFSLRLSRPAPTTGLVQSTSTEPETPPRRGAHKPELVPLEVRTRLSNGLCDTANFIEQFAIDLDHLLRTCLPDVEFQEVNSLPLKKGLLGAAAQLQSQRSVEEIAQLVADQADTIRAVGAIAIGIADRVAPGDRLELLRPYAADRHFAVREWSWIGLRHSQGQRMLALVDQLASWSADESDRIRRFACESIRPRGVWCQHLDALKSDPSLGLPVLEPLRNDESEYVRMSLGNWLSDARWSRPHWVTQRCDEWFPDSDSRGRDIRARALRNAYAVVDT
jgi:3-methyladenine DNA glycosylase AlkC